MPGRNNRSATAKDKGKGIRKSANSIMAEQEEGDDGGAKGRRSESHEPVFELVVLGSGGGPLETDCSGYLLKPHSSSWEDGFIGLEGGSGLGALSLILASPESSKQLFPNLKFPPTYNTPVLRASYIFSYLSCYLITHAHLDHTLSLIMLTGSVPPRANLYPQPPLGEISTSTSGKTKAPVSNGEEKAKPPRLPIYATRETLERLAGAYGGGLWPELGTWAAPPAVENSSEAGGKATTEGTTKKRRRDTGNFGVTVEKGKEKATDHSGPGVVFTPTEPLIVQRPLHPGLPISTKTYPVCHGSTSHGLYTSAAIFIRYDPASLSSSPPSSASHEHQRTFIFFGDLEGESSTQVHAAGMNREVWRAASDIFKQGNLSAIFIECSYDSSRPSDLMFGHLNPPTLYQELRTLASFVATDQSQSQVQGSLKGLKVYITHIKEALAPHPSGRTSRDIIMDELRQLERDGKLGVEFEEVKKGDRILI